MTLSEANRQAPVLIFTIEQKLEFSRLVRLATDRAISSKTAHFVMLSMSGVMSVTTKTETTKGSLMLFGAVWRGLEYSAIYSACVQDGDHVSFPEN
jgi:hypothetical protein